MSQPIWNQFLTERDKAVFAASGYGARGGFGKRPAPQDIVVLKQKPSGFFGTNLASYLTLLGADSIIVTGTTTSGCVRATVLDAFSMNYHVAIAEDGCFDRSQASHAINLCDMNAKYADVMKSAEVLDFIDTLPEDLFDLPKGSAPKMAKA